MRHFKLKKSVTSHRAQWLDRKTVYEGKLISMTNRVVRLFQPNSVEPRPYVDLSYDWVTPVQ